MRKLKHPRDRKVIRPQIVPLLFDLRVGNQGVEGRNRLIRSGFGRRHVAGALQTGDATVVEGDGRNRVLDLTSC